MSEKAESNWSFEETEDANIIWTSDGKVTIPKFKLSNHLPNDEEVGKWFDENIDGDSASSAIYKFRLWLLTR